MTPQTGAYFDVWFDGEKAFSLQDSEKLRELKRWARSDDHHKARYGKNRYPIYGWEENPEVTKWRWEDPSGLQNFKEDVEPMYGIKYLPRKFKVSITVPTDNSVDIYVDDIGIVVLMDEEDQTKVKGYNVLVGGGMGRSHNNEETFALSAEHLGFVKKEDIFNVVKSITCI